MSYLIALLSGCLTALPLLVGELFLLPWVSLVPLFVLAVQKKSAYRHGLVFSLGYYLIVYHWFCYLYPMDFAGLSRGAGLFVVVFAWLAMSVMQGVGTAFVPFLYRRLIHGRHAFFAPFAAASLWCVMEWAQTLFWFGVPWARLAVTQTEPLALIQGASLFGSLGVGFLMVLVNGFLAIAYLRFRESGAFRLPALIALGLFVINLAYGTIALSLPRNTEKTLTAVAVQGNIASGDKWADDSLENALRIYTDLTKEALNASDADIVLWPETVLTTTINRNPTIKARLSDLAREIDAYLAVGAFHSSATAEGLVDGNSLYLFHPDGTVNETVYHKRHLVPFGEYVPMRKVITTLLPALSEINLLSTDLTAGEDAALFSTELGTFGGLICFDSIYDTLASDSARNGAELLLLSTNDSWYKDSAAVYQHNGHAALRAIENGRYIVRAANTGISSIISDRGEILTSLDPLVDGYVTADVALLSHTTLYNLAPNLIVWLSMLYLAFLLGWQIYGKQKRLDKRAKT